eukprot:s3321_g2.t1
MHGDEEEEEEEGHLGPLQLPGDGPPSARSSGGARAATACALLRNCSRRTTELWWKTSPRQDASMGDDGGSAARLADWAAVSESAGPLRIMQAGLGMEQSHFMVDCLGIDSVVVSSCVVRQGASLEVAEFFCGGFSGWSQAAYILHSHGFPINVAWTIDVDPACSEMLRYQHDPWHEISQLEDLYCTPLQGTVHVCADINTNWWLTLFQTKPVNLVCVCVCTMPAVV